jgi:uncharacterized membrane protein
MLAGYNWGMKGLHRHSLMPLTILSASFLCLLLLALFTSPLNNIAVAVFFFLALLIFLGSLGYGVVLLQNGQVTAKNRERIFGVSIFLVVLLMFRSVGSLGWVGGLILLLIIAGWLFYVSHRS